MPRDQWLLQIVNACLEKDPEKRYPSGMALQEALFAGSLSADQPAVAVEDLPGKKVKAAAPSSPLV